ncbi:muts2 family protein [Calderihabitans maritimus]|uniref:Endonuclease MutS2 n=1 Tax=Calderihabitans maritimus TaxID=1246530 RepID=A0A1Z5HRX1_9FIRM|nr:muts2 family protein [Calderihabitans maritimus]
MVNEKSIRQLELPKILAKLKECCTSSLGKKLVEELHPSADIGEVSTRLQETTEAREVLRRYPLVPLGGIREIEEPLRKAQIGRLLEPFELLAVVDTLRASRRLKKFLLEIEGDFPLLKKEAASLAVLREIEREVNEAITPEGEVADHASAELLRIRKQIRNIQDRIKKHLESILRSPEQQKYLQEKIITLRGDRYVVPVKQEYRSFFPGLVHDQSASGATLFIEPMAVVELNNELRRLKAAEQKEIEAILAQLTTLISAKIPQIRETLQALARIDFIMAKGRLSERMDAGLPSLNQEGRIKLIGARHPLIPGSVVPISLHLGKDFDILVITGPNTGGKTVTLKTVGLLTLMAQCGLHVPAEAGTELAVFGQVFADIGDEQSIEQSLSTFSSHMTNIVNILQVADDNSLVLLDELGAGTDPTEGSALAIAILEYLQQKRAKTIATTHYSELKIFAFNTDRVENASVEFDIDTLQPTYRLTIGLPGRSNAFEIASRLGLSPEVVNRARQHLSGEEMRLTELLQELEEKRRVSERERKEIEKLKGQLELLKNELELKKAELEQKEARILKEAYEKGQEIIKEYRQKAEAVVKEMEYTLDEEFRKARVRAEQQAREKLKDMDRQLDEEIDKYTPAQKGTAPSTVKPGDYVEIPRLQQKGYVVSEPNTQGEVQVQVGILKLNVPLKDIRLASGDKATEEQKASIGRIMAEKTKNIRPEIDLRGMTVEEAVAAVERYLDDAVLSGLARVFIIHGKGTGALRTAIREYLSEHKQVKNFWFGSPKEGGTGVTVVELTGS